MLQRHVYPRFILLVVIGFALITLVSGATQPAGIGVFRPATHIFFLKNGDQNITHNWGLTGDTPLTGDWNGDGVWDVGVHRNSTRTFYLKNGTANTTVTYGTPTDIPITGDWNGDGLWDIGIFRPADKKFWLRNGSVNTTVTYGTPTDIPLTGDWNGDGLWDVGVFRPSMHYFFLKNGTQNITYNWGLTGDTPITGDWNGDGRYEVGVHRNTTHSFYLKNGTTNTTITYGTPTDRPVSGIWTLAQAPVANFTGSPRTGIVPLTVSFTDESTGSPTAWNWDFGDGNTSTSQNPEHTYEVAGDFNVTLVVTKNGQPGNLTRERYIYGEAPDAVYDSEIVLNSMPTTMFAGEHYLVDVKLNNTGSKKWFADPANPNLVNLKGLGGPSGDAAKFGIREIPMIFENETAPLNESYDFFFYVHAPDTIGTYTPQYQANASSGTFGEIATATVNVIENPFHPETQPDGSKLYTTSFGNASSGMSVSIVGPRVYIDKIHASSFEDPRFLINPSLKSGVFDIELNDTFSFADVTIPYDPAIVTYSANLSLAYYNGTSGNYTFVASTVDTGNHTVTARVSDSGIFSHGASFAALDKLQYQALPAEAQTEMGYLDLGPLDNSTVQFYTQVSPIHWNISFFDGMPLPPGNYTILASNQYNNRWWTAPIGNWETSIGVLAADDDYKEFSNTGMTVQYSDQDVSVGANVSKIRVSSGVLRFSHSGGTISMNNKAFASNNVGANARYKLYYGDGPAFSEDYNATELENTEFNATETGYDLAVTAYQAAAGCILGQAGKKGGMLDGAHNLIPGWNSAINDDVTESPAYLVGHVACGIAFPYVSLARDFSADMMRGDYAGAALQSLGYLGSVRNIFATTDVIPAFIAKHPQKVDSGLEIMNHLWRQGIYHLELPLATKVGMLDNAFEGAVTRLNGQGVADDVVVAVYERGGNLGKTMRAGERSDGKIVWLEEGTSKWGWQHIVEGHKSQITTKFGPKTDQEIQNMIYNTMISPDQVITKPGIEYQYIKMYTDVSGNLKEFSVIVSDMTGGIGLGNVVTAHPGI